jgi:predicted PurR-regulated permease PerM
MAKLFVAPARQVTQNLLTVVVIGVVVIAGLYWAQSVLIPVALAMFLAFVLAPIVTALQRLRLGRKLSVVIVVLFAAMIIGGVGWLVKYELTHLARDLPTYTENIRGKIKYMRQMGDGSGMERLGKLTDDIAGEWDKTLAISNADTGEPPDKALPVTPKKTATDQIVKLASAPNPATSPGGTSWLSRIATVFSTLVAPVGGLALTLVLVVFMLLEREALRNRVFWLLGNGRVTATTKALDDAGERISRYLLMQLCVNASYGLAWGVALYFFGVHYALLWGFLAAVLRYIPYIGSPVAALLPIALSLAQFPGWWLPIAVIAVFLILELVSNNVIEPWLYGHSIGVSAVGMLIAAAFWTFLWGPIGLVLSGPLTVCLVVLGKHVSELEVFAVLLGDAPALDTDVSYYQRLVARDQDEAAELVLIQSKTSPEQVYDELLVPALIYTKRDRDRDSLTESDEQFVLQATHEVLEDLGERLSSANIANAKKTPLETVAPPSRIRIVACPARGQADKLALEMLRQVLNPEEWDVEITAVETLTAELVAHVTDEESTLICIGALPPGGLSHAQYICKKLRARHPDLKIIVGRWGLADNVEANRKQLEEAGANLMGTSLLETRKQLIEWRPVLVHEEAMATAT